MELKHWESKKVERRENKMRSNLCIWSWMEWRAEGTDTGTQRAQRRRRRKQTVQWHRRLGTRGGVWCGEGGVYSRWSKLINTDVGKSAWLLITEWILVNRGKQGQRPSVWGCEERVVSLWGPGKETTDVWQEGKECVYYTCISHPWDETPDTNNWWEMTIYLSSPFHGSGGLRQLRPLCLWFRQLSRVIGSGGWEVKLEPYWLFPNTHSSNPLLPARRHLLKAP